MTEYINCPRLRPFTERESLDGDEYCFDCDYEGGNFEECPIHISKSSLGKVTNTALVPLGLTPQIAETYLITEHMKYGLSGCAIISREIIKMLMETEEGNKIFAERMDERKLLK